MKSILRGASLLMLAGLLQGCSSFKCYIESCKGIDENAEVMLAPGEEKAIFDTKRGMMWAGYLPGLMAADTTVVEVFYKDNNRGHTAYVRALKEGSTKVYFVNRLGAGAEYRDPEEHAYWLEYMDESESYFTAEIR